MSANGNTPHVELGSHSYPIYPQRWGYLNNKVDKLGFADAVVEGSPVEWLGERVYDVLAMFIPKLMPLWEFRGFGSQEAMDAGEYDEALDKSPDWPQIVAAVELAMRVNRFDLFKNLGKVVDQETRSALVATWLSRQLTSGSSPTESSTTTPPTTSTESSTTPPTPTLSAA